VYCDWTFAVSNEFVVPIWPPLSFSLSVNACLYIVMVIRMRQKGLIVPRSQRSTHRLYDWSQYCFHHKSETPPDLSTESLHLLTYSMTAWRWVTCECDIRRPLLSLADQRCNGNANIVNGRGIIGLHRAPYWLVVEWRQFAVKCRLQSTSECSCWDVDPCQLLPVAQQSSRRQISAQISRGVQYIPVMADNLVTLHVRVAHN